MKPNIQLTEYQLKEMAIQCDRLLTRNIFDSIALLTEIYENKLYTFLGFDSMEEYCQSKFQIARTTFHYYLQISRKFFPADLVPHGGLKELGIAKLKIIAQLDDKICFDFAKTGLLKVGNSSLEIEKIKSINRDDLQEFVSGIKAGNEPGEQLSFEFETVYEKSHLHFQKIINYINLCPEIVRNDKVIIQKLIVKAGDILEAYKLKKKI